MYLVSTIRYRKKSYSVDFPGRKSDEHFIVRLQYNIVVQKCPLKKKLNTGHAMDCMFQGVLGICFGKLMSCMENFGYFGSGKRQFENPTNANLNQKLSIPTILCYLQKLGK